MPRYIIKLGNFYLEWSTVVDAPVTFGMPIEEFKEYCQAEYGRNGCRDLERRLERVEECGTSSLGLLTPFEIMKGNRAGRDESKLSLFNIVRAYCFRQPLDDGWIVPVFGEK